MPDPRARGPKAPSPDRLEETRLLLRLAREVTGTLDLQEVLDRSLAALRTLIDFGGGAIQLIEEGALAAAATDPPASPEAKRVRIPVGEGVSGGIAATGEPVYIPDITIDPRVPAARRRAGVSSGVRSYFGAPLIVHGQPIGVLQIDAPRVDAFPPDVQALVLSFVPTITAAVQNARLYAKERDAAERLREAQQPKRDFVSMVSHELRNPLATVAGFAETLSRHLDRLDPETARDAARRIRAGVTRIERLVDDLLDLSQVERGRLALSLGPTDVGAVVRTVAAEQADVTPVEVEVQEDLPAVVADEDRLHQVVSNLIVNARRYSPSGSAVRVDARSLEGWVLVSVEDHGKGIPADMLDRVFEPFFRVDDGERSGGLGLGLHLSRALIQAMGGDVGVESEVGRGSRFTVRLPARARAR